MSEQSYRSGSVTVLIEDDEEQMGVVSARRVADQMRSAVEGGKTPVLWLMAAPSGLAFYRAFTSECRADRALADLVRRTPIYQFDDYPIARNDPRFAVTFRALLEEHLFAPLTEACGPLEAVHPLELTGTARDAAIAAEYAREVASALADDRTFVIELKGIGMDGHWGFHGAETPLDAEPGFIEVAIGAQNVRQQRIDWPALFPRDEDVPSTAYTATVGLFLRADSIVDNVPQSSKEYAVLACYGNDAVSGGVPSSALKRHANATAVVTRAAARALVEYRSESGLPPATRARLDSLWDDAAHPQTAEHNRGIMHAVLKDVGIE